MGYKIIKKANGWAIQRPDGSLIDDYVWKERKEAEKRLEFILAYLKAWSEK